MSALLAAILSMLVGLVTGAAIQRWGDGTLATEHHTKPLPHSVDPLDLVLARWAFSRATPKRWTE